MGCGTKAQGQAPNIRSKIFTVSVHPRWIDGLKELHRRGELRSVSAGVQEALRQCFNAGLPPFDRQEVKEVAK